jgi:8-oxo-dGTP diphosphatase
VSPKPGPPRLVVAAVIRNEAGAYLLARRRPEAHLGGLWEFPGGAMEPGEQPAAALEREIREELGVEIDVPSPLTFAWHRDSTKDVLLLFFRATIATGQLRGLEGQEIGWFAASELGRLDTPPADAELVAMLQIQTPSCPEGQE